MKKTLTILTIISIAAVSIIACDKNEDLKNEEDSSELKTNSIDTRTSPTSVEIANIDGTLNYTEAQLLAAFNDDITVQALKATSVHFLEAGGEYQMAFTINNGDAGYAYDLVLDDDIVSIASGTTVDKHTCAGAPCNECKLITTVVSFFEDKYSCDCNQGCNDCKCNHTVSTLTGGGGTDPYPAYSDLVNYIAELP